MDLPEQQQKAREIALQMHLDGFLNSATPLAQKVSEWLDE